jgi:hypothetical protein
MAPARAGANIVQLHNNMTRVHNDRSIPLDF